MGATNGDRFTEGNSGGPGSPHPVAVARLRSMLFDTVSDENLREVVAVLVEQAKGGDARAIRELLDRLLGKPCQAPEVRDDNGNGPLGLIIKSVENQRRLPGKG